MKISKAVLFTAVLAAAFIITSCHQPLTELLIAAIEDEYDPVIVLDADSIKTGDTYYSMFVISGDIEDDSLSSGDGKGLIRSISFIASSLKGRIEIDAEGNDTPDMDFGTGSIDYDSNRHFEIEIDANDMGYTPQILNIPIYVEDFNGNESTYIIQLYRSEGPYITIIEPSSTEYMAGDTITIKGIIADSFLQDDEWGEISTLKMDIQALGISAELDLENGVFSDTILSRGVDFTFYPSSQEFFCSFVLLAADDTTSNFRIDILAQDKLDQTTPENIMMTQVPEAGPKLLWSLPYRPINGKYYYSGNSSASYLAYDDGSGGDPVIYNEIRNYGWVISRSSSRGVSEAEITLKSTSYSSAPYNIKTLAIFKYEPDPVSDPHGLAQYLYDIYIPGSLFRNNCTGKGSAFIILEASDDSSPALTSSEIWNFTEDSDGPVASLVDLSTDPSGDVVGDNHTVTVSFSVDDGSTGIGFDLSTLTVTVAGTVVDPGAPTGDEYEVIFDMQNASQSDGKLQIDVYSEDYIGNPRTTDLNATTPIQYYGGSPVVSLSDFDTEWGEKAYARTGEDVTVYFESTQPLGTTPVVTIGGASATVTDVSGGTEWSAIVNGCTDSEGAITVTITGIENVVGTAGTFNNVDLAAWYYPGDPGLDIIDLELVKDAGNSGSGPEDADVLAFTFTVTDNRVLKADPNGVFIVVTGLNSGNPLIITKDGAVSAPDYRYTYTLGSGDAASLSDPVDYTVTIDDAAGNDKAFNSSKDLTP